MQLLHFLFLFFAEHTIYSSVTEKIIKKHLFKYLQFLPNNRYMNIIRLTCDFTNADVSLRHIFVNLADLMFSEVRRKMVSEDKETASEVFRNYKITLTRGDSEVGDEECGERLCNSRVISR